MCECEYVFRGEVLTVTEPLGAVSVAQQCRKLSPFATKSKEPRLAHARTHSRTQTVEALTALSI